MEPIYMKYKRGNGGDNAAQGQSASDGQIYDKDAAADARRKALCIGINYVGSQHALHGCVNDADNMRKFLITKCGYREENIRILADEDLPSGSPKYGFPTRKLIIEGMKWLVEDAQADDLLFFHYSGHGGLSYDPSSTERDGHDEMIFPVDYQTAGQILDDTLHDIMVDPLPIDCHLTAVFDSCHSGSVLDLMYRYTEQNHLNGVGPAMSEAPQGKLDGITKDDDIFDKKYRSPKGHVVLWSGCEDSQTSADTVANGKPAGAMSHAFINSLEKAPDRVSYRDLIALIRTELQKERHKQIPQLSCSHKVHGRHVVHI